MALEDEPPPLFPALDLKEGGEGKSIPVNTSNKNLSLAHHGGS